MNGEIMQVFFLGGPFMWKHDSEMSFSEGEALESCENIWNDSFLQLFYNRNEWHPLSNTRIAVFVLHKLANQNMRILQPSQKPWSAFKDRTILLLFQQALGRLLHTCFNGAQFVKGKSWEAQKEIPDPFSHSFIRSWPRPTTAAFYEPRTRRLWVNEDSSIDRYLISSSFFSLSLFLTQAPHFNHEWKNNSHEIPCSFTRWKHGRLFHCAYFRTLYIKLMMHLSSQPSLRTYSLCINNVPDDEKYLAQTSHHSVSSAPFLAGNALFPIDGIRALAACKIAIWSNEKN